MGKHELYDQPSTVKAKDGEVSVDGPDGVAVSLTPEAAVETGGRLIDAGAEAAGQRRRKEAGDAEAIKGLRAFDDETLLDMYDHAHETSDAHCEAIAAELTWRGIMVKPCDRPHPQ